MSEVTVLHEAKFSRPMDNPVPSSGILGINIVGPLRLATPELRIKRREMRRVAPLISDYYKIQARRIRDAKLFSLLNGGSSADSLVLPVA